MEASVLLSQRPEKIASNSHGAPKKIEAVELKTFLRVPYHTCAADKSHAVSVGSTCLSRTRAAIAPCS